MIKTDKMGIIADDLTGSNDSGVQLAKKGLRSSVIFDLHDKKSTLNNDVIIIDTDSRAISAKESYEVTREAALFLKDSGYSHIYKKVDSTLRGNLGYEIKAVMDVFHPDFCVIAPAFPRIGRVTKEGTHYLHGVPIHETEISKDPKCPVTESFIPKLLEEQVGETIGFVRTKELGSNLESWRDELAKWSNQGVKWLVVDAEEDEHLHWISSNVFGVTQNVVWVGSAGLAEYLPDVLGLDKVMESSEERIEVDQVLVVSGSLSSITRKQIERLLEMDGVKGVEMDPVTVFEDSWSQSKKNYIEETLKIYNKGYSAVLYVDSSEENRHRAATIGQELNLSASEISNKIASGLGEVASELIQKHSVAKGVVLTGGDTAKDVCRHMGVKGLQLLKEVEPGIPLGKLVGDVGAYAITKAGAFGEEFSLVRAVRELRGVNNNE